ncbi:hypothetical protein IAD21_02790 [Abditibacteriota bacterium]|nr:hypothetical protein IAD21_02790 [Abditibacteriota bacterium]
MQFPFKVQRSQNVFWLVWCLGVLLFALAGCSSNSGSDPATAAVANDPQKAALAAQQGAAADAANRQQRKDDEARRAASPQTH